MNMSCQNLGLKSLKNNFSLVQTLSDDGFFQEENLKKGDKKEKVHLQNCYLPRHVHFWVINHFRVCCFVIHLSHGRCLGSLVELQIKIRRTQQEPPNFEDKAKENHYDFRREQINCVLVSGSITENTTVRLSSFVSIKCWN